MTRRALVRLAAAGGAAGLVAPRAGALAQAAYPTKSIHLIVPFPPAGGTDTLARVVGQELSKQLGQAVVIENKPGVLPQDGMLPDVLMSAVSPPSACATSAGLKRLGPAAPP